MIHRVTRKMSRYVNQLACYIEEGARANSGNWKGRSVNYLLNNSVADRLLGPTVKAIAYNPMMVLLALTAVYAVFCLIWLPLWLISLLVTWWGSMAMLATCIVLGARAFARTIMFPGSTQSLQKQYSIEFLRRLCLQVEHLAGMAASIANGLMVVSGGRAAKATTEGMSKKFRELQSVLDEQLPDLSNWLQAVLSEAASKGTVTAAESEAAVQLRRSVEATREALQDMRPLAADLLSQGPAASAYGSGNSKAPLLHAACKKLLKTSEALTNAAYGLRPRGQGGDAEEATGGGGDGSGGFFSSGIFGAIKAVLTGKDGPTGLEKLALPFMREQLRSIFGAERFTVVGGDENIIDGVYIPSAAGLVEAQRARAAAAAASSPGAVSGSASGAGAGSGAGRSLGGLHQASDSAQPYLPPSPLGTVLFCSPNAGLYECTSQATKDSSWLGFYTQLGFDVAFFNYR